MENNIKHFGNSFYFNDLLFVYVKVGEFNKWQTPYSGWKILGCYYSSHVEKDKQLVIQDLIEYNNIYGTIKTNSSAYFPKGTWVKAKLNGIKRYVTGNRDSGCFYDDGKLSGQKQSIYCHYYNYEDL